MSAAATTFTACALVQTHTETVKRYAYDSSGTLAPAGEETRTTETGRIEFVPMGEWVLVRVVRTPGCHGTGGAWHAHKREEARQMYKAHAEGKGWHRGKWTPAEATTKIVGAEALPARRVMYSWGETAYMYCDVDLPAMTCPVIEMEKGRKRALQPFVLTVPPGRGDPYGHTSNRIEFAEVA